MHKKDYPLVFNACCCQSTFWAELRARNASRMSLETVLFICDICFVQACEHLLVRFQNYRLDSWNWIIRWRFHVSRLKAKTFPLLSIQQISPFDGFLKNEPVNPEWTALPSIYVNVPPPSLVRYTIMFWI